MGGRLEGKVCVITGAASGIGAESVELFAAEGARVAGLDLTTEGPAEMRVKADVGDEARREGGLVCSRRRATAQSGKQGRQKHRHDRQGRER